MKKKILWLCSLSLFCIFSASTAFAEVAKDAAPPALNDDLKAEFTRKIELFTQTVALGENTKDPIILLSAVKMLDELPFKGIAKTAEEGKPPVTYDRDAILNQAKGYAAGDKELLAVIVKVQDSPEKVAVRGYYDHRPPHDHYRPHYGHRPHDPYYYERYRHHRAHYGCTWMRICRHGDCWWSCR